MYASMYKVSGSFMPNAFKCRPHFLCVSSENRGYSHLKTCRDQCLLHNSLKCKWWHTAQFYKGSPALSRSYYLNSSNEEYVKYMKTYRALLSESLAALMPGDARPNETHIDELIAFETQFANVGPLLM